MSRYILDEETSRFGRMLHYVGVLLAVVCGTLTYSLTHAPLVREIVDVTGRLDEVRQSLGNTSGAYEERVRLKKQIEDSKNRINALYQRVPADADTAQFLRELSRIAQEENVRISQFQPGTANTEDGYSQMKITLSGQGRYASVCTFFHRVSELPRLSKVQDLKIEAPDSQAACPMEATIVIYFDLSGIRAASVAGAKDV